MSHISKILLVVFSLVGLLLSAGCGEDDGESGETGNNGSGNAALVSCTITYDAGDSFCTEVAQSFCDSQAELA